MAGKIEIVENTLLKLLIRRGTNADRLNVTLSQGELGFTTDTKKLYIGDSSTVGGIQVTGSKFLGEAAVLTSLSPGDRYDMAFNTSTQTLNYIASNDGSTAADWVPIAGLYSTPDGTIELTASNGIILGAAAGAGLIKDSSNRLEIASAIATDRIAPKTSSSTYLELPSKVAFGQQNYDWPANGNVNTFLRYNAGGALTWEAIGGTSTTFVNADIFPVGTIIPFADTTLPANGRFLRCDGSYVSTVTYSALSAVLGTSYGALSTNANSGIVHFKLPDLRGKYPLGYTTTNASDLSGNVYTFSFATSGGLYKQTLSAAHIPAHNHFTVADATVTSTDYTALNGYTAKRWNDPGVGTGEYYLAGTSTAPTLGITSNYGTASALQLPVTLISPYLALNYIIKALPDPIANCQITIGDSLSASLSGTNVFNINPLSGTYIVGLQTLNPPTNLGYINVNNKGLVSSFDTSSAGNLALLPQQNTPVTHSFGFINYLRQPVSIASGTLFVTIPNTWSNRLQVYPQITTVAGAAAPAVALPPTAKNVILDVVMKSALGTSAYVYSSMNSSLSATSETPGANEYVVGANNGYLTSNQITVPLSANTNNGNISFVLRGYNTSGATLDVRIIGWTM